MPFIIVRNDITTMAVDAIVNSANPLPEVGAGVDAGIHKKAGPELLTARRRIGEIAPGGAAITPGFDLPAKYVIHVVGPVWRGGGSGEEETLSLCFRRALDLAFESKCESVVFPLISTGNYGLPNSLALRVAIREFSDFLTGHDMTIYLAVFSKDAFELSEKLMTGVRSYIDEKYIETVTRSEYSASPGRSRWIPGDIPGAVSMNASFALPQRRAPVKKSPRDQDLDTLLRHLDAGFTETLLRLIDRTGKKDSEIYKKANIDRKLFSKIRNNPSYRPSKPTAVAFAIALELDLRETLDLLAKAGYTLSHSSKFDVIVEHFIVNGNYDVFELNEVLFAFDEPLIGG